MDKWVSLGNDSKGKRGPLEDELRGRMGVKSDKFLSLLCNPLFPSHLRLDGCRLELCGHCLNSILADKWQEKPDMLFFGFRITTQG